MLHCSQCLAVIYLYFNLLSRVLRLCKSDRRQNANLTHACNVSVQYYVLILLLPSKRNAWLLVSINLVLCLFLPAPFSSPVYRLLCSHLVIICCFPLDFFTQWDCAQVSLDGGTLFGVCAHERLTYAPKACAGTQSRLILTAASTHFIQVFNNGTNYIRYWVATLCLLNLHSKSVQILLRVYRF